jgi:hypothetical protein
MTKEEIINIIVAMPDKLWYEGVIPFIKKEYDTEFNGRTWSETIMTSPHRKVLERELLRLKLEST